MNLNILYQWTDEIARHLPSLNGCQIVNLSLFSYGVVLSWSSQQSAIARRIACGELVASAVKRLQRFTGNEKWCNERFFVEWSSWVISKLRASSICLLVDETKLKDRMGIMMIGLAFENRCIPLYWTCYKANSSKDYRAEGQVDMIAGMLRQIQQAIPADRSVLVLADRGIGTSPRLCQKIDALGLNYLFRITKQSKISIENAEWMTIYEQVRPGQSWSGSGKVFKKRGRVPAHVRAIWKQDYDQPWLLVTNDPQLSGYEYALRNWQEQGFRELKSGGWNWAESYVSCPRRMTRLIAILVLAYAWIIGLGCHAVAQDSATTLIKDSTGIRRRKWSLFKEGLEFFYDYVIRKGLYLPFTLIPDNRLC